MNRPTRGSIEAEASNAVVRFHREQQGRGPADVRAHLMGDMLVVRCRGIFTPTESHLCSSEQGRRIIRSARQELRTIAHTEIETVISEVVGVRVLFSYYDINVEADEQMEIYVLEEDMEKRLLRQDLDQFGSVAPRRS